VLEVDGGVSQVPAPGGKEFAETNTVGKQFVDDLDDAFVLKEVVVAVLAEKSELERF
jgi:hypothetical protein